MSVGFPTFQGAEVHVIEYQSDSQSGKFGWEIPGFAYASCNQVKNHPNPQVVIPNMTLFDLSFVITI